MKKPEFDDFREIFLECLSKITGQALPALARTEWDKVGPLETRREALKAVSEKVLESYGIEFEVNQRLLSVNGPVESAIIQAYHELNTIYLMEKINAKIRSKLI